jgi:transcriptional regulator with XRE-family HTH domain
MNGQALRAARQDRKLTLQQLAAASGIALSTISDIEHGRIEAPGYETVVKLAGALGLDPSSLWPVDVPPPAATEPV